MKQWMYEKLFYHIEDALILWLRTFLLELGIETEELEDTQINWDRTLDIQTMRQSCLCLKKRY